MSVSYSHGREFVEQIRPFLEASDPDGLVHYLAAYWPQHQLRDLIACKHDDAIKVAAVCLGLIGTMEDNDVLASLLRGEDSTTLGVAEHAMWSIWFRSADAQANSRLRRAVRLISENDFDAAIDCLDRLLLCRPDFAEAYNQRAIAYFLKEAYSQSLTDCRRTLRLNPYHFGAMAGVGHCHASLGNLEAALEAYSRALQIHPRMDGLRQSVHQIRAKLKTQPVAGQVRQAHP